MQRTLVLTLLLLALPAPALAGESALAAKLLPLIKAHRGRVAVAIKHLGSGETFLHNADAEMPTASLIKFPVMIEVYQQVLEGKIKLTDMVTLRDADKVPGAGILTYHFSEGATFPLRDAVRLMIVFSDNTATNLVLDKIGIAATGKRMQAWGFPKTSINAKVFKGSTTSIDKDRTKKFGLGSTNASEMVMLFEKLHREELVSKEASKEMLGHLKKCDDRTKLKRFLSSKIEVAHKTGSVSDVKTDAGILYLPTGPVAICVLTANNEDKVYRDDNDANVLIGRIAHETQRYFEAKAKK